MADVGAATGDAGVVGQAARSTDPSAALRVGGLVFAAGAAVALAVTAAITVGAPGRVSPAAIGAATIALALLGAILAAVVRARRVDQPAAGAPLGLARLVGTAVIAIAAAALLLAGARALVVADAAARAEARVAADALADFAARLVAVRPAGVALPAALAPPGGAVRIVRDGDRVEGPSGISFSPEDCATGHAPTPCATRPLDGKRSLVAIVAPASLAPVAGSLLVRGGVLLAFLIFVAMRSVRLVSGVVDEAAKKTPMARAATTVIAPAPATPAPAVEPTVAPTMAAPTAATTATAAAPNERDALFEAVGDELKAPLERIEADAEALAHAGRLTHEQREDVALILSGTRNLRSLIDGIIDLSELQASEPRLDVGPVDLGALAGEVARAQRPLVEARGIGISVEAAAEPAIVAGDAQRLKQVTTNLVSNAVKFTEHGQVIIAVRRDGEAIELSIQDSGSGIEPEAMAQLFQPYEQAEAGRSQARGTGLGLAISKRLVEAHGGAITVESTVGVGSTFRVRLPIAGPTAGAAS